MVLQRAFKAALTGLLGLAAACGASAAPARAVQAPTVWDFPHPVVIVSAPSTNAPHYVANSAFDAVGGSSLGADRAWTDRMVRPCTRTGNRMVC